MQVYDAIQRLRMTAAILLLISVLFPLYSAPTSLSGASHATYTWDLARDDFGSAGLLALAFFGPVLAVGLHASFIYKKWSALVLAAELGLLGVSAAILIGIACSAFTMLSIFRPWLFVTAPGTLGAGIWLAMTALGALQLMWLLSVGKRLIFISRRSGGVAGAPA